MVATLAYRDILRKQTQNANQHSKNSQFSSHRITAPKEYSSYVPISCYQLCSPCPKLVGIFDDNLGHRSHSQMQFLGQVHHEGHPS